MQLKVMAVQSNPRIVMQSKVVAVQSNPSTVMQFTLTMFSFTIVFFLFQKPLQGGSNNREFTVLDATHMPA